MKSHLRSGTVPFSAPQLDALLAANAARSRELAAAERETEAFWVSEYFRQQTAANPGATWRAQLISWASQDAGTSERYVCALVVGASSMDHVHSTRLRYADCYDDFWPCVELLLVCAGWGKVMLTDLGLETALRIDGPAALGDEFDVRCAFVDTSDGIYKLQQVAAAPAAYAAALAA